jgi:hypothetical protein
MKFLAGKKERRKKERKKERKKDTGRRITHKYERYTNVGQGCTNSGRQVAVTTKSFMVTLNILGSSVWKPLHFTILSPRI